MPSAKTARVSERRRSRNLPLRTRVRTVIARARRLIESGDLESAGDAVREAVVAVDKAAQKGALHKGNAARRKSRLMIQLHKAKGQAAECSSDAE